jgi:methyl-accepting chemotaxis protein
VSTTAASSPDDDTPVSAPLEMLRIINQRLEEAVKQEEDIDYRHSQSNQRTQLIGRIALVGMLVLTPPIFYLIWTLVGAMGVITERMGAMYGQIDAMRQDFDQVATHVSQINTAVGEMNRSIAVMPPMNERLQRMRGDIDMLGGAMSEISPDISRIGETIVGIDRHMGEMHQAFGVLNRDMFIMRRNVNQMSSPMRMMPFFGQ